MLDPHPQPVRPSSSPALPADTYAEGDIGRSYARDADSVLTLPMLLDLLRRRWYIPTLCLLLCWMSAWIYASRQTPIWASSSLLLITPSNRKTSAQDIFDEMAGKGSSEARSLETQVEILKRPFMLEEAGRRLGLTDDQVEESEVVVEPMKDTSLVSVTVEHADPEIARKVADEIATVYLERTRADNQKSVSQTRKFLEGQLATYKKKLTQKEKLLEQAKRELGSPDIATQIQQQASTLEALKAQLNDAKVQRNATLTSIRSLETQLEKVEPTITGQVQTTVNPVVSQLQGDLATLETQRTALLKEYQPNQPEVTAIDSQIASIKNSAEEGPPRYDRIEPGASF